MGGWKNTGAGGGTSLYPFLGIRLGGYPYERGGREFKFVVLGFKKKQLADRRWHAFQVYNMATTRDSRLAVYVDPPITLLAIPFAFRGGNAL